MSVRSVTPALVVLAVIATLTAARSTASGELPPAIVFSSSALDSANREIHGIDVNGTAGTPLTHHDPTGSAPQWALHGTKIAFVAERGTLWLASRDGSGAHRVASGFDPALSPSGRLVAEFVSPGNLEVRRVGGGRTALIRTHLGANDYIDSDGVPSWSPDERLLAYTVTTETDDNIFSRVYVVNVDGTGRRLLGGRLKAEDALPAWSPTRRLAMLGGRGDDLVVLNGDGSDRKTIAHRVWRFSWSPTGRDLAYVGRAGGIYVTPVAGGRPRRVIQTTARAGGPVWGPRGQLAFSDDGLLYVVDVRTGRSTLMPQVGAYAPSWWPGRRIVFGDASGEIFVIGPHGQHLVRVTHSAVDSSPRWSPDGRRIAFVRIVDRRGVDPAIFVAGPGRLHERRLAEGSEPAWAPDSRRIAFAAPADDPNDAVNDVISVVATDRPGRQRLGRGRRPTWSPDGRSIAYLKFNVSGGAVDGNALMIVGADGTGEHVLLRNAFFAGNDFGSNDLYSSAVWSPGGSQIAVVASLVDTDPQSGGTVGARVAVVDVRTGATKVISNTGANDLAWAPDGSSIAAASGGTGITLLSPDGAPPASVVAGRAAVGYSGLTWSPDGKRLAYARCDFRKDTTCAIHVVNRDGSRDRPLTHGPGDLDPAWRPR